MSDRKHDTMAAVAAPAEPRGFFGGVAAVVADALDLDDGDKPKTKAAPEPLPLPGALVPYALLRWDDDATGATIELRDVTALPLEGVPGFTVKRGTYSPTMRCAVENRIVWRAILAALANHEPLEPVTGEPLTASEAPLHTELVALRDYYLEAVTGSDDARANFVRLMLMVAAQKYQRTADRAAAAVQKAWTSPWAHSSFRARRITSDADGSAPEPQRPLDPRALERLAKDVAALPLWICQGEGIEQARRNLAAAKAKTETETAAAKAAETERNRLVTIIPADEGLLVVDTQLAESGRTVGTFAWPFPITAPLSSFDGPIRSVIRPPTEPVELTAAEVERAHRVHPMPASVFVGLVADMRAKPGATDPIPESEMLTQKSGNAMRTAIGAFRRDVEKLLPALKIDGQTRWFIAGLLQSGVRARRIHPLAVAAELERVHKKMGSHGRAICSDVMRLAENAYAIARGGSGAWCPPGFLEAAP